MEECSQLLPWERYEVRDCWIEGSSSCPAQNRADCLHTIADNMWRASGDSRYCPQTIANEGSDCSTRKKSNEARFGETTVTQIQTNIFARHGPRFDTNSGCQVYWTHKLSPLHEVSLVNYHIEIGYGRRYDDGSHLAGGIYSHIMNVEDLSLVKAICVPSLLRVSCVLISETKLWDMIFHQCVCKGHTGHAKVLDSKSDW